MHKTVLLSLLTLLVTTSAQATTYTMVDCLSKDQASDLRIGLKDVKGIDYAEKYDGLRGQMTPITQGQTVAYTSDKFSFTGKIDGMPMSIEFAMSSADLNNGTLTIAGKAEKVQCYISDVSIDE